MDRYVYNAYKSIVTGNGKNVKGNIVRYMKNVIKYETPNENTIAAILEVEALKKDPNKKTYESFAELLKDVESET